MIKSRKPPANVARALRQEAGFGCVLCGNPFVEYHHIIPWEEDHHYRINDMVAVCPGCHHRFHAMPRAKQYRLKHDPINKRGGGQKGSLEVSSSLISFNIATCILDNCRRIIGFEGEDLFSWRIEDGEFKISLHIQGPSGTTLLRILDNEIMTELSGSWDVKFQYNRVRIWTKSRKIFAEIDIRQNPAKFLFETHASGAHVRFGRSAIFIKGERFEASMANTTLSNIDGYIFDFFDSHRTIPRMVAGTTVFSLPL